MKRVIVLWLSLFLVYGVLDAQKSIHQEEQTWFGFFNQTRYSKHWGSWTDIHFRLKDDFVHERGGERRGH